MEAGGGVLDVLSIQGERKICLRALTLATKRISQRMIETKYQEVASDEGLEKRDINV